MPVDTMMNTMMGAATGKGASTGKMGASTDAFATQMMKTIKGMNTKKSEDIESADTENMIPEGEFDMAAMLQNLLGGEGMPKDFQENLKKMQEQMKPLLEQISSGLEEVAQAENEEAANEASL